MASYLYFLPSAQVCYFWISTESYAASIQVHNSEGPLFRKSTIRIDPKPNPKADPNPNFNPTPNPNFNPNVCTVAHICTMDFWNSGLSK